jgi:hypothetical protein
MQESITTMNATQIEKLPLIYSLISKLPLMIIALWFMNRQSMTNGVLFMTLIALTVHFICISLESSQTISIQHSKLLNTIVIFPVLLGALLHCIVQF